MPPAVQGREIFKVQPFLAGVSSRLSSVAGACKGLCSPAEGPGVILPVSLCSMSRAAPGGHGPSGGAAAGSCAWALLKLFLPPLWQCCRWSRRAVLRNIIPEWKLLNKINHCDKCLACAVLKVLFYFQWSCCRRLAYTMRLPCVLLSASPQSCPPFLLSAWCCSQGLHVLHFHLTNGICWGSHFDVWKAT